MEDQQELVFATDGIDVVTFKRGPDGWHYVPDPVPAPAPAPLTVPDVCQPPATVTWSETGWLADVEGRIRQYRLEGNFEFTDEQIKLPDEQHVDRMRQMVAEGKLLVATTTEDVITLVHADER